MKIYEKSVSTLPAQTKTKYIMITLEENQIAQVENGTFSLINGDFTPDEASEIVNDLFSKKINFHEVKSFGHQIRYGTEDQARLQRIEELKESRQQAGQLIEEAKQAGKSLRVQSVISIEFI